METRLTSSKSTTIRDIIGGAISAVSRRARARLGGQAVISRVPTERTHELPERRDFAVSQDTAISISKSGAKIRSALDAAAVYGEAAAIATAINHLKQLATQRCTGPDRA